MKNSIALHCRSGLAAIVGLALLAGCVSQPTTARSGRALLSPEQAAAYFDTLCFKPGGSADGLVKAAKRDTNLLIEDNRSKGGFVTVTHKTLDLSVNSLPGPICGLSFQPANDAGRDGADAVLALVPRIEPKTVLGAPGSGRIVLPTAKGQVMLSNTAKYDGRAGLMIALYSR